MGSNENMKIYNLMRETPQEAQKKIGGGRLKGFTDINPMWRIKRLTEVFGPCGDGWKYDILKKEILQGAGEEKKAFVDINLYYITENGWSEPIFGTGGASFVSVESGGLYTNDECFKMALTDAIGTACKALGMSADIYFDKDRTKYTPTAEEEADDDAFAPISEAEEMRIRNAAKAKWGNDAPEKIKPILEKYGAKLVKDLKKIDFNNVWGAIKNED